MAVREALRFLSASALASPRLRELCIGATAHHSWALLGSASPNDERPYASRTALLSCAAGAVPDGAARPHRQLGTFGVKSFSSRLHSNPGACRTGAARLRSGGPLARELTSQALQYSHHGAPGDVLRLGSLPVPQPGPNEVVVQFLAAPINPSDINIIEGKYPFRPTMPATPGNEGVGVVLATGVEVSNNPGLRPGMRVVPLAAGIGTWRSHAVLPADSLYCLPEGLEVLPSAAITINPPTALCLLEKFVDLEPGSVVVQNGANSAVGQAVIEIAATRGIHTVNIIRERPNWDEVCDHLKELGGSVVTTLEKAKEASDELRRLTVSCLPYNRAAHLPKPALALNCVGGPSATKLAKMLRPGGTMVTYGGMSLQPVTVPTPLLIFKDIHLRGFALSMSSTVKEKRRLLDTLVPLMQDKGLFTKHKYQVFDLQDFHQALAATAEEFRDRKVALRLSANVSKV